jgi:truncated hemoglobin YjbI
MSETPFELVGGADRVRALVERFYWPAPIPR